MEHCQIGNVLKFKHRNNNKNEKSYIIIFLFKEKNHYKIGFFFCFFYIVFISTLLMLRNKYCRVVQWKPLIAKQARAQKLVVMRETSL